MLLEREAVRLRAEFGLEREVVWRLPLGEAVKRVILSSGQTETGTRNTRWGI
jgi:hypothetical protein